MARNTKPAQVGTYASEAALPSVSYRDIFRDLALQAIIERAVANNQDVRIALANVASARRQLRVQRSVAAADRRLGRRYGRGKRHSAIDNGRRRQRQWKQRWHVLAETLNAFGDETANREDAVDMTKRKALSMQQPARFCLDAAAMDDYRCYADDLAGVGARLVLAYPSMLESALDLDSTAAFFEELARSTASAGPSIDRKTEKQGHHAGGKLRHHLPSAS